MPRTLTICLAAAVLSLTAKASIWDIKWPWKKAPACRTQLEFSNLRHEVITEAEWRDLNQWQRLRALINTPGAVGVFTDEEGRQRLVAFTFPNAEQKFSDTELAIAVLDEEDNKHTQSVIAKWADRALRVRVSFKWTGTRYLTLQESFSSLGLKWPTATGAMVFADRWAAVGGLIISGKLQFFVPK